MKKHSYHIEIFTDHSFNNKSGIWYRFWWKFLLGAKITKMDQKDE